MARSSRPSPTPSGFLPVKIGGAPPAARRVVRAIVVAGVVAAAVAAGGLAWLFRAAELREARLRGDSLAAAAAVVVDGARAGGRSFAALDRLREGLAGVHAIAVVSTDGRSLWPPGGGTAAPPGALTAERVVPGVGKVLVSYSSPARGAIALVAFLPFIVLVVLVIAARLALARHVLRPMAALEQRIDQALVGDFVRRVSLPEGDRIHEVDTLLRTFNKLLAKITDLSVSAIDTGRELDETRRELTLKAALEEQKRVAESANALLEARVRELSLLFEVSRVISATVDLDEVLGKIAQIVGQRLELQELSLMLLDESRRRLDLRAAHGFTDPAARRWSLSIEEGIAGFVARTGDLVVSGDAASDPRWLPAPGAPPPGSLLCAPARFRGEVIGVVNFGRAGKNSFRPEDILYLSTIAEQCAIALGNAQLYERALGSRAAGTAAAPSPSLTPSGSARP